MKNPRKPDEASGGFWLLLRSGSASKSFDAEHAHLGTVRVGLGIDIERFKPLRIGLDLFRRIGRIDRFRAVLAILAIDDSIDLLPRLVLHAERRTNLRQNVEIIGRFATAIRRPLRDRDIGANISENRRFARDTRNGRSCRRNSGNTCLRHNNHPFNVCLLTTHRLMNGSMGVNNNFSQEQ